MTQQALLVPGVTEIDTVVIRPTKAMPRDVFVRLHRLSVAMEHMERLGPTRVLWDETVMVEWDESLAEAEYEGLHRGWFSASMELPRCLIEPKEVGDGR